MSGGPICGPTGSPIGGPITRHREAWQAGGVNEEQLAALADFEAEMSRRSPYGIHPEVKTGALAEMSEGYRVAAGNLLAKAVDRILRGADGADRLIARAVAIPFDEHDECWPGPTMAGQLLFEWLSDVAEEWAEAQEYPEDDESVYWLHEDIPRIGDGLDADEVALLKGTVETLASDGELLGISGPEIRGLDAIARKLPGPGLQEHARSLTREATEEQRELVLRRYLAVYLLSLRVISQDEG